MPLCERCSTLNIADLINSPTLFQPDLGTIKASAESGCEFCLLCWETLQRDVKDGTIRLLLAGKSAWLEGEEWTPTIWLQGLHFDWEGTGGAMLTVSCGRPREPGDEEHVGTVANPFPSVGANLEVYELPERPSRYSLRGRRTTADQDPQLYIPLIQQWLNHCLTNHGACGRDPGKDMPTRVIDVGHPARGINPRLVSSRGMKEPYIALSYCWGEAGDSILTLNAQTYDRVAEGVSEAELATTHRDLLGLARALNIRYVWIDALCIVQGDAEDWERESKVMVKVYANSLLTVIAGRSSDSRDGFINNPLGYGERPRPCLLPIDPLVGSNALVVDLPRSAAVGPVSGRGWCFQERMSCRRAIIFAEEQLMFECSQQIVRENGIQRENLLRSKFLQPWLLDPSRLDTEKLKAQTLQEWYAILNRYVLCQLSHPTDIFAASTAMAQRAGHILRSRYLAGLWECDMVRGLLWRPCYHFQAGRNAKIPVTRPKPGRFSKDSGPVVRSPSWSWAAVEGPVAQDTFPPSRIAKFTRPDFVKVRRTEKNEEKWSSDTNCGVDALHMIACELQFMGKIVEAQILPLQAREYGKTLKSNQHISTAKICSGASGILLGRCEPQTQGLSKDEQLQLIEAVGCFDVDDERKRIQRIWCLLVVQDRGLLLSREPDGRFSRLGWFQPIDDSRFKHVEETEIRLC